MTVEMASANVSLTAAAEATKITSPRWISACNIVATRKVPPSIYIHTGILFVFEDLCRLPQVVGPCDAEYEQFYYDASTDTCNSFIYGGCEGNYNRFPDRASCEQRCKRTPPTREEPIQTQAPPGKYGVS